MAQTKIQINSMRDDHHFIQTNDVLNLKPHVIYVGQMTSNDFFNDVHNHPFCEILLVKEGGGTTTIDGETFEITKGDIVIYNFQELHQEIVVEKPMTTMFATIGNLHLVGLDKECLRNEIDNPIIKSGESFDAIVALYQKMIEETTKKRKFYESIVQGLATELIVEVLRLTEYDPVVEIDDKPYLKAKEYIDANYNKQITLDDICDNVYISKFYLSRSFKKNMGLSPIKYIIFKRIEKAEKLLKETDYRVKKIATIVGYEDDMHFCKTFKKYNK
ncbi:MAG: AraC family transcriptional regulator, partial [Clostridia bacterium]